MQIKRVINFEDTMSKHVAVCPSLNKCGITEIDHATTAMEGLAMMDVALEEGRPYDLVVSDMYFQIFPRERVTDAGMYVIEELKNRNIDVPIIVCSSCRLYIPEIVGCIYYRYGEDIYEEMRTLIEKI